MNPQMRPLFERTANVLEDMPRWLTVTRALRRLSLREVAEQTGLSIPCVSRAEHGLRIHAHSALQILRWLGRES